MTLIRDVTVAANVIAARASDDNAIWIKLGYRQHRRSALAARNGPGSVSALRQVTIPHGCPPVVATLGSEDVMPVLRSATLAFALGATISVAAAQDTSMSFFITSVGVGDGANLGGLEGADAHCTELAEAAGVTGKTWRAYLSTSDTDARDRIGSGPWYNAQGELIAQDVAALHDDPNINKQAALDESGSQVNGRGDTPNRHDVLTGSTANGTKADETCGDWTLNSEGSAIVGHHDRTGGGFAPQSWNAAHASRGCSQEALRSSGGDGLFYCFATN